MHTQGSKLRKWSLFVATLATAAFLLQGCGGSDGAAGPAGAAGAPGAPGATGPAGKDLTNMVDAAAITPTDWGNLSLTGSVTSVDLSKGTPVVSFKIADDKGNPVKGLGFTTKASTALMAGLSNMNVTIAKLVPGSNGSPSKWVNYLVMSTPTVASPTSIPTRPTTDSVGTLKDNGDGSYVYTFWRDITKAKASLDAATYTGNNTKADLGDVTYEPNLTHRVVVYAGGNARGTGTNSADGTGTNTGLPAVVIKDPANIAYDFIPATGKAVASTDTQRIIVSVDKCNQCHTKLRLHGNRVETKFCVVCHSDQLKYGYANSTLTGKAYNGNNTIKVNDFSLLDLPNFVHKIHMGEELAYTGYNVGGATGLFPNEVTYPQDQRNCVKCHTASTATPQGDNWKNVPSRLACGGCHDGINFATGGGTNLSGSYAGHIGGAKANDSQCTICHDATSIEKVYHVAVLPPNSANAFLFPTLGTAATPCAVPACNSNTNASNIASVLSNLPAGASKVTWLINSVTVSAGVPSMTFKFQKDGQDVVFNNPASKSELMDNFVGGPSIYWAFGAPQDGITKPADWNGTVSIYLKRAWNGTAVAIEGASKANTLTGPDANGWYTITMTASKVPLSATMVMGGIGYTYGLGTGGKPSSYAGTAPWTPFITTTQPLTQTNVAGYAYDATTMQGGLSVPAPNANKLATVTGGTAGTNAARRPIVETARCNACHQAIGVFTAKTFHAGQRNDAPTCTFCHNVNRVNSGWGVNIKEALHSIHAAEKRVNKFSWEVSAGDKYWTVTYPAILNNCEACHLPGTYDFSASATSAALPNLLWTTVATGTAPNPLPTVVTGNEPLYATYWSPFVTAGAAYGTGYSVSSTGTVTEAAGTTLVSSPIASACFACHDSATARVHIEGNGGKLYVARSTVTPASSPEQCLICHGPGKVADIKSMHMTF